MQAWLLGIVGMIMATLVGWGIIEPRETAMVEPPASDVVIIDDAPPEREIANLAELVPGPFADIVEAEWPAGCTTQRCETRKRFIASATTSVEFVKPLGDAPGPSYVVADGRVHVFVWPDLSAVQNIVTLRAADPSTFAFIDSTYAKDAARVYYIGGNGRIGGIPQADPATFRVEHPFGEDRFSIGIDEDSVFYESKRLSGIDPATMIFEQEGDIIRDADTVYFNTGNCNFRRYDQGEMPAIATYRPAC